VIDTPVSYFYASYSDSDSYATAPFLKFFPGQNNWGPNVLDIEVDFTPSGLVNGTIDAYYNGESDVHLVGENGLFTVVFSSDKGICYFHCVGAQGVIAEGNSVPEPSTAALMGLAMLGLAARRYVPSLAVSARAPY
jgi:hypothetical protein